LLERLLPLEPGTDRLGRGLGMTLLSRPSCRLELEGLVVRQALLQLEVSSRRLALRESAQPAVWR